MLMRRGGFAALSIAGLLALAGGAGASYHDGGQPRAGEEPAAHVDAEGNFAGGLAFDPAEVSVRVGDIVEWTNTDPLVPHTATEDHGLWDLGGDYGETPANPPGFGPGETVSRDFDAGTFNYYCRVHGHVQEGVVEVPVTLRSRRTGVVVRWGSGPLPEGQVFDVQRQASYPGGSRREGRRVTKWRTVLKGTRDGRARFDYGPARITELAFRARVRDSANPEAVSGWSPPAALTLD